MGERVKEIMGREGGKKKGGEKKVHTVTQGFFHHVPILVKKVKIARDINGFLYVFSV